MRRRRTAMMEVMAVFLHVLCIYMIGKLLHDAKSSKSLRRKRRGVVG